MANRSYLFTIDFDGVKDCLNDEGKVQGLSEFPYAVPLAYKILVSQNAKICQSILTDECGFSVAIQGNFDKGVEKLFAVLNDIKGRNLFDSDELEQEMAATKTFLEKYGLKNVILENVEIYEMEDEDLTVQNQRFFENEILNIEKQIIERIEFLEFVVSENKKLEQQILQLKKTRNIISRIFSGDPKVKIEKLEAEIEEGKQEMWNELGISDWSSELFYG